MRTPATLFLILCGSVSSLGSAISHAESAVTASIGTTGVGVEWIAPFSEKLHARFLLSYASLDRDLTEEGIDYKAEWDSTNLGAVLDWHPFAGGFRLTAGLLSTSFGFDLTSESNQANFDIGDRTYTGDLQLDGELEFADVAPYLALGWSSRLDRPGFYIGGEIGVMYLGEPSLAYRAFGTASSPDINGGNPIVVSNNGQFQADLEQERQSLQRELEDYSFWPILNISIGYRY